MMELLELRESSRIVLSRLLFTKVNRLQSNARVDLSKIKQGTHCKLGLFTVKTGLFSNWAQYAIVHSLNTKVILMSTVSLVTKNKEILGKTFSF